MLIVTALTGAVLALQLIRLSIGVIALRRRARVSLGDGGDVQLQRAVRAQGNCAEYAPIMLILLGCAELNGVTAWLLLPLAIAFVVGRVIHPMGIASRDAPMRLRVLGMHLTFWPIVGLAAVNVLQAIRLMLF